MNRREALSVVGMGVVGLTAGCAGFGGIRAASGPVIGTAGTPAFEVSVDAPSPLRVGSTFSATVTVTNTGDGPGTYEGTVGVFADMLDEESQSVTVGPVGPGESVETTVGPMVASYAGG